MTTEYVISSEFSTAWLRRVAPRHRPPDLGWLRQTPPDAGAGPPRTSDGLGPDLAPDHPDPPYWGGSYPPSHRAPQGSIIIINAVPHVVRVRPVDRRRLVVLLRGIRRIDAKECRSPHDCAGVLGGSPVACGPRVPLGRPQGDFRHVRASMSLRPCNACEPNSTSDANKDVP